MLPLRLALEIAGDLASGFSVVLRYRALGLLRGTRVLRAWYPAASPPAGTPPPDEPPPIASPPPARQPSAGARGRTGASGHAAGPTARARLDVLGARVRLAERLLRSGAVRIERPRGWLAFALADPAETGRAFGFACALATLADPRRGVELRPLWSEIDRLDAELAVEARVLPLRVLLDTGLARLAERRRGARGAPAGAEAGSPDVA